MLPRRFAVLCLPALLAFPAAASAEPFHDRVITGAQDGPRRPGAQGTTQDYADRRRHADPGDAGAVLHGRSGDRPDLRDLPRDAPPRPRARLAARDRGALDGDGERLRRRRGRRGRRRDPRLLRRRRPDDDRPRRPGRGQRLLRQLRDRARVRAPHRRQPLQRAAAGAGLRAQALVLVRARVQEHDGRPARPGRPGRRTTARTPARPGPRPTRGSTFPTEAWTLHARCCARRRARRSPCRPTSCSPGPSASDADLHAARGRARSSSRSRSTARSRSSSTGRRGRTTTSS